MKNRIMTIVFAAALTLASGSVFAGSQSTTTSTVSSTASSLLCAVGFTSQCPPTPDTTKDPIIINK